MSQIIYTDILFKIIGGLGFLIFGIAQLSEGMQKIADKRLKYTLENFTGTRIKAVLTGFFITSIIQSSSVTSVMVVGVVNAALLSLNQALGVILGANIGTTVTGWLLFFKIGEYGLPLAGASAMLYVFSKDQNNKIKSLTFMSLGLIFFGLEVMSQGLKPISSMPEFLSFFHLFDAAPEGIIEFSGVLKAAFAGLILTAILQSSSVTVGITITLAVQGILNFETATALVLGENIGTTVTAYLASLGANENAKRVAYGNFLIKFIGACWILPFFSQYVNLISRLSDPGIDITKSIALAHTLFNIINSLVFLPFIGLLSSFLERYINRNRN